MTDDFDLELRQRLGRIAMGVPIDVPGVSGVVVPSPVRAGAASRPFAGGWLAPALAVAVVGALAAGVALLAPWGQGAPTNGPIQATTVDGPFELSIWSVKARYAIDEPIEIKASITYGGPGASVQIAHAQGADQGPLGFGIVEPVIGDLRLTPSWQESCERSTLQAGKQIVVPFAKSAAWSGDDPRSAAYKAYVLDPVLRLVAGTWHAYAVAEFSIGDCKPDPIELRAEIPIEVLALASPSIESAHTTATPIDPTPSAIGAPEPTPTVQTDGRAIDQAGGFEMMLRTGRLVYRAGEPIDAVITLSNVGVEPAPFVLAASPLVALSVTDVGGNRHAEFESGGCGPFGYWKRGDPVEIEFRMRRTYGVTAVPDSLLDYVEGDHLTLPAGTWKLRAFTRLWGPGCDSPGIELETEVTITIEP